jgi:hypothetical protein
MSDIETIVVQQEDMQLFSAIDSYVSRSVLMSDPTILWNFGRSLCKNVQLQGHALAKLLFSLKENWQTYNCEDDIYDVIQAELGIRISTAKKYVTMWERVFSNPEIPDNIKQQLLGRNMKTLLLLSATAEESEIDWSEVVNTNTDGEVRELVRKARGEQTSSKTRITIYFDHKSGELTAVSDDHKCVLGMLIVELFGELDPLIQKATERIIKSAGIIEK